MPRLSKDVHDMFSSIARRYDLTNDVLSFFVHRLWRRDAVRLAEISPGARILDLCCGTGDFAFALNKASGTEGLVVGVDFVAPMLVAAKRKYLANTPDSINNQNAMTVFLQGDALHLPFQDASFDVVSIAFGIRNVDDVVEALQEIRRVLRNGGKALILEFGQPRLPVLRELYDVYGRVVMPRLGQILTGNKKAYEYLPKTAGQFPSGASFQRLMHEAGFSNLQQKRFLSGIAYAYTGISPCIAQSSELKCVQL